MAKRLKNKIRFRAPVFAAVIFALLAVYAASLLLPFLWGATVSLRSEKDFYLNGAFAWPSPFRFDNYAKAFRYIYAPIQYKGTVANVYYFEMLFNSFLYSLGAGFMMTLVPCLMAYVTAKYKFRFNKAIYGIVVVTMILPVVGSLPSEYQIARALGFVDSFLGVIVMKSHFLGMYFLVFYAAFRVVPWEYAESAMIDGASHYRIMLRVMLPLAKTAFFTVLLLNFIALWNDYQSPMIYLPNHPVAAYGFYAFQFSSDNAVNSETIQMAGAMIMALPVFALFAAFNKRLMGNLTVGGLKG
ncbi:MAG: carbohydrate ABC transporter permease [Clostridiales bacterium]|jgi:N-acetylglucosamine transport system permease protein|nr:carbohydrate ABC transporter permease [Clostridiales bacterium]